MRWGKTIGTGTRPGTGTGVPCRLPCRTLADRRAGFNLITMSIFLTVASIIMVSYLPGQEAGDINNKSMTTVQKLGKVETALTGFMVLNGRLPCPADGQYGVDTANFGIEGATPGTCTGGTPAAPFGPDVGTGYVVGGVIPTKTLNLEDSYAFDEWGRRITYVVDKRATGKNSCASLEGITLANPTPTGVGGIKIENSTGGTVLDNVMHSFIIHGPDGHGAFPTQGSSVAGRINTGAIDADKLTNAGVDASFAYSTTNFTNVKVMKDPTATFNDIVYYAQYQKNLCCVGTNCVPPGFRVDGMAASMYSGENNMATGDVNGDGIPDLIIGGKDAAYVVFGTKNGFPNPLPLNSLNGTNGFKIWGYRQYAEISLLGVGDVNGDGYADILLDSYDNTSGLPAIFVLFGHANPWTAAINNITTQLNGSNGFEFRTASVSYGSDHGHDGGTGVGDVNGDGLADMMFYDNTNDRYYVIFGTKCGGSSSGYAACSATYDPTTLANGTQGFYLSDNTGSVWPSPAYFADVNGDGVPDILMLNSDIHNVNILFGNKDAGHTYWAGLNGSTVTSLMDGTHGATITGTGSIDPYFGMGLAVADITDVNSNASPVLIISSAEHQGGAYGSVASPPTAYLIPLNGFTWGSSSYVIETLVSAGKAYWITGDVFAIYGFNSIAVGDINGDGINDIILCCPQCTADSAYGSCYVIYGTPGALSNIDLKATPRNGTNGFRIDCSYAPDATYCGGYNGFMGLLTADMNGDGISDLIINSQNGTTSAGVSSGYTYVLCGSKKAGHFSNPFPLSNIQ